MSQVGRKEKEATQALSVDWAQGSPDVPALGGLASRPCPKFCRSHDHIKRVVILLHLLN